MKRNRMIYAGLILGVIAAGLASRSDVASHLPVFVGTYAGDTLWALTVFLGLGFVFPGARTAVLGVAAVGISFAVEFSQLWQVDWLNGLRATRIGALTLGSGFIWSDLVCYLVGVLIGVAGEAFSQRWVKRPESQA